MDDFGKFFNGALKFLSYRSRSEKEVRAHLLKKKAPKEIIDAIIERLKEHKFLDDVEFARRFLEQRTSVNPKALRIVKMELRKKGISDEIIEGLNFNTEKDLESARKLLEKKIEKYKGLQRAEIYNKLGGFLARRGFNWDTIKKAIDETFDKVV